jgi:hypothetical protein
MTSTYVNDLRLNEMGTGDESGSWGNVTNTNLELIGEGLSFTTKDCFASDGNQTETVADGATDPVRGMYLKVTSSATLSTTRVLTIAPNDMSRMQYIENATTGSQIITIKQGSGATVNIASGQVKAVYLDGAGSGAAVVDAFANLSLSGTPTSTTAGAGTNTTQLATTAFVKTAVDNAEPFPSGTSMLFQQTAAPTGWTKSTTHNDKALRLTSGTVGTGGSVAFSTAMATPAGSVSGNPGSNLAVGAGNLAVSMSGNISNTSLSTAQLASHSHSFNFVQGNNSLSANPTKNAGWQNPINSLSGNANTNASGSGSAHNHSHNLSGSMTGDPALTGNVTSGNLAVASTINVQYVDFIIANKD